MALIDIPNLNDLQVSAIFTDRFTVRTIPPNVRLTFGQTVGDDVKYSTSIVVTLEMAQELSSVIKELLQSQGLWKEPQAIAEA